MLIVHKPWLENRANGMFWNYFYKNAILRTLVFTDLDNEKRR